jgi:glycosyltransferase involved in cell wall biosynthesis
MPWGDRACARLRFIFVKRTSPVPSGGHRQIRLLAAQLNRMNVRAELMFADDLPGGRGAGTDWTFDQDVPVSGSTFNAGGAYVTEHDILVFPETEAGRYLRQARNWPCRRAVFVQNGFYALARVPRGGYARNGADFAIATSPYIVSVAQRFLGMPESRIFQLPCCVDAELFRGEPERNGPRQNRVAFMPRKLRAHVSAIKRRVERLAPGLEWIAIDNANDRVVGASLRSCGVFLSTQDREGFGLPAIEAMTCGCIVAGYRGTDPFPHPYATPENGFWARDRSVHDASRQVVRAVQLVATGGGALARLQEAGALTAGRFRRSAFDLRVAELVRAVRDSKFSYPARAARMEVSWLPAVLPLLVRGRLRSIRLSLAP